MPPDNQPFPGNPGFNYGQQQPGQQISQGVPTINQNGTRFSPKSANYVIGMVHGDVGVGFFWVAPGCTAYLFDQDSPRFFIKAVDEFGRPLPIQVYRYTRDQVEQVPPAQQQIPNQSNEVYASKEDISMIQDQIAEINKSLQNLSSKMNYKKKPPRKEPSDEQSV